ncbi:MAG TPA: efflux RND transporter periplasmic adaptor subunit [Candidatus Acidoferrum sp.]|nr:efflux RND transporter periplasmic adaptor subunit [Candidatus Acidoferrum sp.]
MFVLFQLRSIEPNRKAPLAGKAALAILAATLFAGCGQKTAANNPAMPAGGMPVQVQPVKSATIPDTTEYLSVLKSRHSANINPQVEGQIVRIFVKSGDRVKAGQALLQIDPLKQQATVSSQEAARAAQQANVSLAKISFDRAKKLFEAGVIAKAEFDSAQSNYEASVAQLKALEEQVNTQRAELKYYAVAAPMDGIVGDIPVRMGDRVAVTTLLTTVDEPGALEAYVYVPVERSRSLRLGLPVKLLDQTGTLLASTSLTFVSPQVDPDTQTVLAKAAVPNSQAKLRVSQQVRAQITWGERKGATIPFLSINRINGQYFAFVAVNEGKGTVARQKLVRIGDNIGNDVEVLDGIKAGDHLIVSGTQFLQDGVPVTEQTATAPPGAQASQTQSNSASD